MATQDELPSQHLQMSKMTVTHLSTRDTGGGAARAAYRLHRGLREVGTESTMYVRHKRSTDSTVQSFRQLSDLRHRLQRLWRYGRIQLDFAPYRLLRPDHLESFSDDRTRFQGEVTEQLSKTDVLHLHWIARFVDLPAFFEHTTAPIVWTLHDMNAFTGGCHYDAQCGRYKSKCGKCPQLGSQWRHDLSRAVWKRKRKVYQSALSQDRLYVVTPSEWLAQEARQSELLREAPIQVIPNGIDPETFYPRNCTARRHELGILEAHDIVLFVAQSTNNHRKGFDLLIDALDGIDIEGVTLLSVGGDKPSIPGSLPHVHAGRIEDDKKLAEFYSMASVFVIPSRQDNLPNTVLESMACGTPVIGTDAGGIPDMVRPNETGWLAETGDIRSLREAIESAIEREEKRRYMAQRCLEVSKGEYTLEKQAKRYKKLYEWVINK